MKGETKVDNNNTCKLRSIIMDYAKFQKVNLDDIDKERSYIKDRTREIKALCKCLNLDLQQFYVKGKNEYEIPNDVARVISVYLRKKSQRGSTIYKMKKGEYDRISDIEKTTIFESLMKELKSNAEDDISTHSTIGFLEKQFSGILKQNDRRIDTINQVKEGINNKIARAINAVTGLNDKAGLMVFHNGYSNNEYHEEIDYEYSLKKAEEAIREKMTSI